MMIVVYIFAFYCIGQIKKKIIHLLCFVFEFGNKGNGKKYCFLGVKYSFYI